MIIAIDGPAGAGKSTVAKTVARKLGVSFLDTGAMYRALTLKAIRQGLDLEKADDLVVLAQKTIVVLEQDDGGLRVVMDGEDVSAAIRKIDVTNKTHFIAREASVRAIIVEWQRDLGKYQSLVGEGRDVGTVVFPKANYKFYLDATPEERCFRRAKELRAKGEDVDEVKLLEEIKLRDKRDSERVASPLKKAEDAIVIDTTGMSVNEVADKLLFYIR